MSKRESSRGVDWMTVRDATFLPPGRLKPITPGQEAYLKAIDTSRVVICVGPAGTGKTYQACGKAAEMFKAGVISKIIVSRPLIECDEEIGTLPGDLLEKISDMMRPVTDYLDEFFGRDAVERMTREGSIEIVPLGKFRGRTVKNAMAILDEAQNATYRQLRMFLNRIGTGSRFVVVGDPYQSDLPTDSFSRLVHKIQLAAPHPDISIVKLGNEDIVRDGLVAWFEEILR